jgi:hypothetical protein
LRDDLPPLARYATAPTTISGKISKATRLVSLVYKPFQTTFLAVDTLTVLVVFRNLVILL